MLQIILFLMACAVPFVLLLWWLETLIKRAQRKQESKWFRDISGPGPRGFEVKLTTGEPPVSREKKL